MEAAGYMGINLFAVRGKILYLGQGSRELVLEAEIEFCQITSIKGGHGGAVGHESVQESLHKSQNHLLLQSSQRRYSFSSNLGPRFKKDDLPDIALECSKENAQWRLFSSV